MSRILCVDDDASLRALLARLLARSGFEVLGAAGAAEALRLLGQEDVDLIISDWQMPGVDGLQFLRLLQEEGRQVPVVMLTAFDTIQHAVAAIRAGAVDYLSKPFEPEQLDLTVARALEVSRLRAQNADLLREVRGRRAEHEIVGESRAVRLLLERVAAAATSRATVLLEGESGTGKELLARAIHDQSDRREKPFVRINCAALPEGLIESTLFGHERGAFTGAIRRSIGAFERANGGTLLLDEISEMRLDLQPKLLRVLQERELERVGGAESLRVDVRIIATTNRRLADEVRAGRFRQDLYYRLSVFPITLPPLRERREDIPALALRFAARAAEEANKPFAGIAPEALALLSAHVWPGNVRELQHAMERAVILTKDPLLQAQLFGPEVITPLAQAAPVAAVGAGTVLALAGEARPLTITSLNLGDAERRIIEHALEATGGNRTRAARLLGIDIRTLRRKLNGGDAGMAAD
ncbi:MAG TPA: sigma-54 dependent transcriptional regulator [Gemmatimonadaceae bacterium]|nr:sigma-54 dependent transcriptional regulator [Gemmatimonadaceae bacterium]